MSKAYFFGYNKPNHKTKIKSILYGHKFFMLGQSFGHQKGVVWYLWGKEKKKSV